MLPIRPFEQPPAVNQLLQEPDLVPGLNRILTFAWANAHLENPKITMPMIEEFWKEAKQDADEALTAFLRF